MKRRRTGRGTATVLDPRSGQTRHTVELDLRADDRIQVSGAPHAARLYVVTGRGVLAVCDLTASACNAALPLGTPGDDFGAAVETADRVFVPDYTSGRVWVVDLHGSPNLEAGVEIDPRRLTPDHLPALREAGFNRASLGVQDFEPKVQEAVHRIQPRAKVSVAATNGLVAHGHLSPDARIYVERRARDPLPELPARP